MGSDEKRHRDLSQLGTFKITARKQQMHRRMNTED